MPNSKKQFLALPVTLSIVGLLFCVWNIYGTAESICLTNGCSLFQDYTIAGFSLWHLGLVAFSGLLLTAILGWGTLGFVLSGFGIVADMFLLLLMLFSAPCTNCLIIAFILACTYLAFSYNHRQHSYVSLNNHKTNISKLIIVWSIIFIANLGVLLQNSCERWAMLSPDKLEDSQIHVYFSPSCLACIELVENLGKDQVLHDPKAIVAWYPVEEKAGDIFIINSMYQEILAGNSLSKSLEYAKKDSQNTYTFQIFLLQLKLWINKVAVLNTGSDRLPLVQYHGLPKHLTKSEKINQSINIPSQSTPDLFFLDNSLDGVAGFCAGGSDC